MSDLFGSHSKIILILVLWLLIPVCISAEGQKDKASLAKLEEAESLIEQQEYDQAIMLITEVARSDPDKFEAAEKLMAKIRKIRAGYNEKYEELIKVLFTEKNLSKAYVLIEELKKLDPSPNKATAESIEKAEVGAAFVYYLEQFTGIMDRAYILLEKKKYTKAVDIYLTGYSLEKERFDNADYGNIIKNSVNASLKSLSESTSGFNMQAAALLEDIDMVSDNLSEKKYQEAASGTVKVISYLDVIGGYIDQVIASALNFYVQNEQIKKLSAENRYDTFLHFAGQLSQGRSGFEQREGTIAAMQLQWESALSSLSKKFLAEADTLYADSINAFRKQDYESAEAITSIMKNAESLYFASLDLQSMWQSQLIIGQGYELDEESKNIVQSQLPGFLLIQEKLKELKDWQVAVNIVLSAVMSPEEMPVEVLLPLRNKIVEDIKIIEEMKHKWEGEIERYNKISILGHNLSEHIQRAEKMISEFTSNIANLKSADAEYLSSIISQEMKDWEHTYQEYIGSIENGRNLIKGTEVPLEPIKDEDGNIIEQPVRVEKYPGKAVSLFESAVEGLSVLEDSIKERMDKIVYSEDIVKNSEVLRMKLSGVEDLKGNISKIYDSLDREMQEARNILFQAERFKREGVLRFQQAQKDLSADKFEQARDNIKKAQIAFDQSLKYQEDPEVRRMRDIDLYTFSKKIVEAENTVVIREVRKLIKEGKESYYKQDFNRAEQLLLKARARYEDTNPDKDKEIELWLNLIRSALTVSSSRVINENDPLYTDMSQLHNMAAKEYLAGKELLDKNRVSEALECFLSAEEKLSRIKIFFPYNREARVLSLKIEQLRDKEAFTRALTDSFNVAVKKINTNPQEAYLDLKDLVEEFNPNYPKLQDILYSLEIKLEIRIAPPNPIKIVESKELYNKANVIVQNNERDLFPVALEQLIKAIELNPNYQEAIILKDRIQIAAGGTKQLGIPSDAEQQLRSAEGKFLAGSYFEALLIVNKLLKDPRNKGYQPLIELKKRIETKI